VFYVLTSPCGTRFTILTIDSNFSEAGRVFGADVDGDGDIDVISASYGRWEIAWWENNESIFTKHLIADNFPLAYFINLLLGTLMKLHYGYNIKIKNRKKKKC
jgi:hypothetical protein